jgi:hypothetical protein
MQPNYHFSPNSIWIPDHFPWKIFAPAQLVLAIGPTQPTRGLLPPWSPEAPPRRLPPSVILPYVWEAEPKHRCPPPPFISPSLIGHPIDSPPRFNNVTGGVKLHRRTPTSRPLRSPYKRRPRLHLSTPRPSLPSSPHLHAPSTLIIEFVLLPLPFPISQPTVPLRRLVSPGVRSPHPPLAPCATTARSHAPQRQRAWAPTSSGRASVHGPLWTIDRRTTTGPRDWCTRTTGIS